MLSVIDLNYFYFRVLGCKGSPRTSWLFCVVLSISTPTHPPPHPCPPLPPSGKQPEAQASPPSRLQPLPLHPAPPRRAVLRFVELVEELAARGALQRHGLTPLMMAAGSDAYAQVCGCAERRMRLRR